MFSKLTLINIKANIKKKTINRKFLDMEIVSHVSMRSYNFDNEVLMYVEYIG